jgi:hypothetical protein
MKINARVIALLALLPITAFAQRSPVDTLRWLAGCWKQATATTTIEEQWMLPSGGHMLGVSRTVSSGKAREHEFLRIYAAGDTLVYAPKPSGQAPTEFRSIQVSANEVVFSNPAHDFPQRIRYRLASEGILIAGIEGDRDGKRQPVVFSYATTECVPSARAASRQVTAAAATPASARTELTPKYDSLVAREMAYVGGINSWYGENADAAFSHYMWTAGGATVPVGTREVLAGAGERMKGANFAATYKSRKFTYTLDKVLTRGDTAEVLVASNYIFIAVDTGGRYGDRGADFERNATERRIDRWVRAGSDWKLRSVTLIGLEVLINGKLAAKDGKTIPLTPPRP